MIFEAMTVGLFVMAGLAWVADSLDRIAKQLQRANDLNDAGVKPEPLETD